MDTSQARRWMEQWKAAATALSEDHARRLAALSAEEALAASEAVLSLAGSTPVSAQRRVYSGLVEQQALFHRRPAH